MNNYRFDNELKRGVILARVSTPKQEQEGLSLQELQLPTLRSYCFEQRITVDKEFVFQESADAKIRVKFNEMLGYVKNNRNIKAIVAYRVDRITRNYRDAVLIDDLINACGIEIHFVYDRLVIDPKTVGRDITDWDTKVFLAKQFLNRLKEDAYITIKRKFENHEWPGKAPFGYVNVVLESKKKWIVPEEFKSIVVIRLYEWYSTGEISMEGVTQRANKEFNLKLSKGMVDAILKNPFYCSFMRRGRNDKVNWVPHNYEILISKELWDKVQLVKEGHHKQYFKYADKPYIFRGMVTCSVCGCMMTPEIHKGIVYYHCTMYGGKHQKITGKRAEWIREDELTELFGNMFKGVQIPQDVLEDVLKTLKDSHQDKINYFNTITTQLNTEYQKYQNRIDQIYEDKLDGTISREEYDKRKEDYRTKQQSIRQKLETLEKADETYFTSASTLLNLANRACEIFLGSEMDEKRQLLGFVLQNCTFDGKNLDFTLKKPFDTLALCATRQTWLPR